MPSAQRETIVDVDETVFESHRIFAYELIVVSEDSIDQLVLHNSRLSAAQPEPLRRDLIRQIELDPH